MRRSWTSWSQWIVGAVVVAGSGSALGLPVTVAHSGVLLGADDAPLTSPGAVLRFRLYDGNTGTEVARWDSGSCTVPVRQGRYAVALGGNCGPGLTDAVFDGNGVRYLEIDVGGVTLAPRSIVAPVPVSIRSADTAALSALLQSPGGTPNDPSNPVDWTRVKSVPAGFADGVDNEGIYSAGAGLTLQSGAFSIGSGALLGSMIGAGQVSTPQLADGAVTTEKLADGAVTGQKLSIPLSLACPAGQAVVSIGTDLRPVCAPIGSSGTGLAWTSGALDFGVVGTSVPSQTATLQNLGTSTVSGVAVTATAGFAVSSTCGATLAAGASCTVTVSVSPASGQSPRNGAVSATGTGVAAAILPAYAISTLAAGAVTGTSCTQLRAVNPSAPDGVYTIDPDGSGPITSFQTYCDMTNGGWTLVASTKYALSDPTWTVGAEYEDLKTVRPSGVNLRVMNKIPWGAVTDMRFTCYASNSSPSYGLDWRFPLSNGLNRSLFHDLYDDAKVGNHVRASAVVVDESGVSRTIGYDSTGTYADWGLGSSSSGLWWDSAAWGQVDAEGGHCQTSGVSHVTGGTGGAGQYHIWVKTSTTSADATAGKSAANAKSSCLAVLQANPFATDGIYYLSGSNAGTYQTTCDMTNGGWTLMASTKISTASDTVWNSVQPYADLQTLKATGTTTGLINTIPIAQLQAFRFTCYTGAAATSYGIDWRFNLGVGSNTSLLGDIYDDARITVYGNGPLTQTTGSVRAIGYDGATVKADWGLGSSASGVYWSTESWGQVDTWGGHCQEVGVGHSTSTLGGAGIYHVWVR